MRCHTVLVLLLLQCLAASGLPLFELSTKADGALRMALDEINTRYARHHLYRVSKASVKKVVPLGRNVYDMILKFSIRETDCLKSSGLDGQGCAYRWSFLASDAGCYVRARVTDRLTDIVSLKCNQAQSSSSESSEETGMAWHYDPNRLISRDPVPATVAPAFERTPPIRSERRNGNIEIRGDHFSNHLV
ncbi:secreted phosphoprotein 24 [Pygocentrus nattereri]|uniref:Secreted phosphoprotein 24 n=1 Tax=Pygocentrus nattereri TaxID=42514 RepID=A0A3B4C0N5_PYGNA|nr:secreted phosphoprotein 24 [Pygocentrus nattereri]